MTNHEIEDIVSSTGSLGLERRSYNRLYCNWPGVISDVSFIERQYSRAQEAIHREIAGRCVLRAVLTEGALRNIAMTSTSSTLEASVPAGDVDGQPVWMTLFGLNAKLRCPITSVEDMVETTTTYPSPSMLPHERVQRLEEQGFRFDAQIDSRQVDSIHGLWGKTFEWTRDGVETLSQRLQMQLQLRPSRREVWFSGVVDPDDTIASVSMAELLRLPLGNGEYITVVESTEWRTREGFEGQGIMAAGVSFLHAQILRDLEELARPPLIIAETNYLTRADRVGNAVGMRVPLRHVGEIYIPQILQQNVAVGDGLIPDGLRDFTMMYLAPEAREQLLEVTQ